MRLAWKLGRVAGIDFYVHPTFLVVFFMFQGIFPGGRLSPLNILMVLAIFGCVLLHELGHALMARSFGINTHDITLYPIGGVARLERMPCGTGFRAVDRPCGPSSEFRDCSGFDRILFHGWRPVDPLHVAGFVPPTITNGQPGTRPLQLDSRLSNGWRRVLAVPERLLGRVPATMTAARVGRGLAVVFGLLSLAYNPLTVALVHVALASFIYMAASAEEAQVVAEERRRQGFGADSTGIWTAPPGYYWVRRGNGLWQLAPVGVRIAEPTQPVSPWR